VHTAWYNAPIGCCDTTCADPVYKVQSKRAGRKKAAEAGGQLPSQFAKKAVFESTKKKEVGVSDLTLISKVSNEAINDNLKKRFENGEIYVRCPTSANPARHRCVE
jgi:myosin heavy subunit